MRRLLVLFSLMAGVQGCTRTVDPAPAAMGEELVAGPGTPVAPPPSGSQTGAAVAFDGTNYLVVWADVRGTAGSDVYAARVGPTGALLGAAPIVVSAAAGDQSLPDVAFDGTNYLVVWQDQRLGGDKNIHVARVSTAGVVLDPASIAIAQYGHQVNPAVAWDGTSFLVVWEDQREASADIRGARVTPAGAVLDAGLEITDDAPGNQVQPAVGCAAGTCLVAWRDGRNGGPDVYGARVTAAGVLDPLGLPVSRASSSQGAPTVAGDGTRFLVAWSDTRNGTSDVYGARVGSDGQLLDPSGRPIASAPGAQQAAAVAFEGAYFLVVWEDGRSGTGYDVYGARVRPTAEVIDPGGFLVEPGTSGSRTALASDRQGRALVVSDRRQVVDPVLGTSVSRLAARILISRATLTVTRTGSGSGTVASQPAGIDCGELCSAFFDAPTDVNLTPTATPGSAFVSWSGACSGSGPCTVTVDDTRAVGAKFSLLFPLAVTRSGSAGSVTSTPAGIDCGSACTAEFPDETVVELTPVAGTNSLFKSWSGDCSNVGVMLVDPIWRYSPPPKCVVSMTGARSAAATFGAAYTLTVKATGTADGVVDAGGYWLDDCATGSTCAQLVPVNTAVRLTAVPAEDAILKTWSGCTSYTGLTCDVTVSMARTVTATFQPSHYLLTAATSGTGFGTITGTGIACESGGAGDCTERIPNGQTATLTAAPLDADSIFKSWSGCTTVSGTSCAVSMTMAKTATARFEPARYPLTLNVTGGGGGLVSSEAPGFTCTLVSGVPCSTTFANGETVKLTAGADGDSLFKSWSGCSSVSGPVCTVTMTGPKTLTVRVEPSTYPLAVAFTGNGRVDGPEVQSPPIACSAATPEACSAIVANGASVTLTATADPDWILKSWTGCTSSSGPTCTVSMTGAKSVTANFQPAFYPLTIASSGGGSGTISRNGTAVCEAGPGLTCSVPVANGDTVSFTAAPGSDSLFKSWSGCTSASGATCNVTMTAAKTITATLQPSTYLLTAVVSATGGATGTISGPGISCATGSAEGCTATVANGATLVLTAAPGAEAIFKSWTGCTSVSGTSCTISMTSAKTATATFQPAFYPLTFATSGGGNGTIKDAAGATVCELGPGLTCSIPVANGATASFTATAGADSLFKSWSSCTTTSGAACNVTMTAAKTVTAVLQPSTYLLTAVVSATGGATGTITGGDIACTTGSAEGCTAMVANGATVVLTAAPGAGTIFKSWMGCTSVSGTSCTVNMTMAKTATATFQPAAYPLTFATSGGGNGTIRDAAGETVCELGPGRTCSLPVANGATASFTATAGADSLFKSWSGCTSTSGATCNVTMTGAKTITATLQPSTYLLTAVVSATGGATGTITGGDISCTTGSAEGCTATVANGATVVLTAAPGADTLFKSWSGCTSVSGTTCTVNMTSAKTATATFQPAFYPLTFGTSGGGSGTIKDAAGATVCEVSAGQGCTLTLGNGATASYTAEPGADSIFKSWTGCTSWSGTTCNVTMTSAKTVTAVLQPSTYLLTVNVSGSGTVSGGAIQCTTGSAEGCSAAIANGQPVTLTAAAGEGALFRGWSGCSTVSGTSCTVNMTSARTVTAYF